jgi:alpha-mannosidase
MKCILVSHTHWDREWHRTFQQFRARLVDTVDQVLDFCAADPGYRFVLDGQSIILEDYLEIRPQRRGDLERFVDNGQIVIGPWYVQPDSLLPSGEAHVRNLLEGRRVAETIGPASRVAYTPDSFGHPAQFPQLFHGFGMRAFVYWRGNGDEIADLPAEYQWQAADGTALLACHLGEGYFAAAHLGTDVGSACDRLRTISARLAERATSDQVLLMNGVDHQAPEAHTGEVAEALARETGWEVQRGVFDNFIAGVRTDLPTYRGELIGGRVANLLPGVWSARTDLKLRNRACETELQGWAEPWAALGRAFGLPDERPALRQAWRQLLQNQAHDSICGCSIDRVHEQMSGRYDAALELAHETMERTLERLAGLPPNRETPWNDEIDVAVFNPSPHPRTDRVRFRIDPTPAMKPHGTELSLHPLLVANLEQPGYTANGLPARVVASEENGRFQLLENARALDVEFVATDVPAFGWKRVSLRRSAPYTDEVDSGRDIAAGEVRVEARDDGCIDVTFGERTYSGILALEDVGDRGDTYDFDPVGGGEMSLIDVDVQRTRHASGLQILDVRRRLRVPRGLNSDGSGRSDDSAVMDVHVRARIAPGVPRVDLVVTVDNRADDHRLRMLFPTGQPIDRFLAASTFDVATRDVAPVDAREWVHPAPSTFPHQGWIHANGLTVVAPGLPEAEVTADGSVAVTLLRAVGYLSRLNLQTRPIPAGPAIPTPAAQRHGRTEARLHLFAGLDAARARNAELGLRAVAAGERPLMNADQALLTLQPSSLELSAIKPADDGDGVIVRVYNPTDAALQAELRTELTWANAQWVRLDEAATDAGGHIRRDGNFFRFEVPARTIRSLRLR